MKNEDGQTDTPDTKNYLQVLVVFLRQNQVGKTNKQTKKKKKKKGDLEEATILWVTLQVIIGGMKKVFFKLTPWTVQLHFSGHW